MSTSHRLQLSLFYLYLWHTHCYCPYLTVHLFLFYLLSQLTYQFCLTHTHKVCPTFTLYHFSITYPSLFSNYSYPIFILHTSHTLLSHFSHPTFTLHSLVINIHTTLLLLSHYTHFTFTRQFLYFHTLLFSLLFKLAAYSDFTIFLSSHFTCISHMLRFP